MHDAEPGADFFGFCDLDDVWLPGKVARAVDFLSRCTMMFNRAALQKCRGRSPIFAQAAEFRALSGGALDLVRLAALDGFLARRQSLSRRLRYALRADTYRQRLVDDVAHRAVVALGYF